MDRNRKGGGDSRQSRGADKIMLLWVLELYRHCMVGGVPQGI
jgi:hypothetical protein